MCAACGRLFATSADAFSAEPLVTDLHYVGAMAADDTTLYAAQCACSDEGKSLAIDL